uniref:Yippee-like 3 n=1 Tax=Neogobius melanostomus TaxID=47308 RepID=A0A8C6TEP2_9GOBI
PTFLTSQSRADWSQICFALFSLFSAFTLPPLCFHKQTTFVFYLGPDTLPSLTGSVAEFKSALYRRFERFLSCGSDSKGKQQEATVVFLSDPLTRGASHRTNLKRENSPCTLVPALSLNQRAIRGTFTVSSDMVKLTKAKTFQAYLDSCHRRYSCVHCRAHLANHDDLISKSFQGSQGRAYLFNSVVNVGCGPAEERLLLTGLHAVADIYCENCHTTLGWKYEQAFELSQKYKEGKYIIELSHMIKDNGWD